MIEIALILSVVVSLITLVARHRLSVRHKALKVTLNRVAGERDTLKWRNSNLERFHKAALDLDAAEGDRVTALSAVRLSASTPAKARK